MPQHPNFGDRVHVRPARKGSLIQRGHDLFNQFLPDGGMECTWDEHLQRRLEEGAVIIGVAPLVVERKCIEPRMPGLGPIEINVTAKPSIAEVK